MNNILIPENYKVIKGSNGLYGIYKLHKGELQDMPVKPCFNTLACVARSYGRIYIMTFPVNSDPGEMSITNYNGQNEFEQQAFNVKFGKECIYIRTTEPRTGKIMWALIDKELKVVKYVGDFEFQSFDGTDSFYLPTNREAVEVAAGEIKYKLVLKTGETEEVIKYVPKKKEVIVDEKPEFYDITINYKRNSVKVNHFGKSNDSIIATINNIETYEGLFVNMLNANPEKNTREVEICRNTEKEATAIYKKIPADVAEAFINIIRTVKSKDDALGIVVTSKYIKEKHGEIGKGLEYTKMLYNEMLNGYTQVDEANGKKYYVKVFRVGTNLIGMLRTNKDNRLVCTMATLDKCTVMSKEDLEYLLEYSSKKGYKVNSMKVELKAQLKGVSDKPVPISLIPKSIMNNKELKGKIKEFDYSYKNGFMLSTSIEGDESGREIMLRALVFDGFSYIPKHRTSDKNVTYSSATNDLCITFI